MNVGKKPYWKRKEYVKPATLKRDGGLRVDVMDKDGVILETKEVSFDVLRKTFLKYLYEKYGEKGWDYLNAHYLIDGSFAHEIVNTYYRRKYKNREIGMYAMYNHYGGIKRQKLWARQRKEAKENIYCLRFLSKNNWLSNDWVTEPFIKIGRTYMIHSIWHRLDRYVFPTTISNRKRYKHLVLDLKNSFYIKSQYSRDDLKWDGLSFEKELLKKYNEHKVYYGRERLKLSCYENILNDFKKRSKQDDTELIFLNNDESIPFETKLWIEYRLNPAIYDEYADDKTKEKEYDILNDLIYSDCL